MPNKTNMPTDKLATSILKLDKTVADAYDHIQQLFTQYEGNIDQILERLKGKNFEQDSEGKGKNFTQQQYSDQKIYNQLLLDQNKAFSEFNIALQQIIEKLDPASRAAKMKDTVNFANNNGMTVKEVSFYRKLGNYHNVDQQHADGNEQKLKKLFDLRGNPDALKKDPMINALTKFDPALLNKLKNAKDLTEFIPMLIDAMARANRDKGTKENAAKAYKEGEKFWDGNDALRALWTDLGIKYIDEKTMKDLRSSKDQAPERHQNKTFEAKNGAEKDASVSGLLNNVSESQAGGQNAADTSLNVGMASLAQSIIEAINKKTNEINDDPTFKGVEAATQMGIQKGLDEWNKIAPIISDLTDAVGALSGGGGGADYLKFFTLAIKGATIAAEGFKAQLESKKYFDKQSLNKAMTMSGEQVGIRLRDLEAQHNNPNNIKTMDYYGQEKGIYFTVNSQTLETEAVKDGKVIAPTVKSLDEITRSLQWLQDPKHKQTIAKMENEHKGLKVDINLETGQLALVDKKGKIAANLGLTHGYDAAQPLFRDDHEVVVTNLLKDYYRKEAEEKAQQKKEAQQKKIAAENEKLREDLKNKVSGHKILSVPDEPSTLPPLPKSDAIPLPPPIDRLPKSLTNIGKITKNGRHANGQNRRHIPNKRQTAADMQKAKECTHMENSNNTYTYDVTITVNPPSGDPIKIAQQVCEQLKHHTCGNNIGYSKDAASRARTGQ